MTPTHARMSRTLGRAGTLALLAIGLALYAVAPSALGLGPRAIESWYVAGWIIAPLWAGLASLRAAARSDGTARKAWHCFALAGFSWMTGTIVWAGYGWLGAALPFPSPADALYVFTAVAFMSGMFHYSLAGSNGSRIQATNFALAITAVLAIGFVIYVPNLMQSNVGWLGAFLAFSYPALWLSALVFGLLCYYLYLPQPRRSAFLLILCAAGAHTFANFFYGFDVLGETYAAGTFYDVFWIAAYGLIGLAALRESSDNVLPAADRAPMPVRRGEALIPALSVAAVLSAGVAAEWHHLGPHILMVLPVIFGFAALLAVREHALFTAERALRTRAEDSASKLAESEARLSNVLENTTDGVMVLDTDWRVTFANHKAVDMLFKDRTYLGERLPALRSPEQTAEFFKHYTRAVKDQTPVEFEAYFPPMDWWLEVQAFPTPADLTVFFRDVTERRRLREELVRLAQHDPLTSLANRNLFGERLSRGLQSDRRQSDLILVLIDLDGFKGVNDSLGHLAGDSLLQQFAGRLTSVVRHGDTVARFGGDEFAIIQPGPVGSEGAGEVARRISQSLLEPFHVQGQQVTLAASIGIAIAPAHGSRPDELIFNADLALYRAKESSGLGVTYCIFEPGIDIQLQAHQVLRPSLQRAATKA